MKKASLIFSLVVSVFFVVLGYYLCFEKPETSDINSTILKVVGVICMVFFGILTLMGLKKLFSK